MRLREIFKSEETGDDQWIATADIMAGLMIIFLFIALITSHTVIDRIAKKIDIVQSAIYSSLIEEFKKDLSKWGAEVDPKTGTIRFSGAVVQFKHDSDVVSESFKNILEDFFPRYVRVLKQFEGSILEINIEGHTNSRRKESFNKDEGFIYNMNLSQRRAFNVFQYSLNTISTGNFFDPRERVELDWVESKLSNVGFADRKKILKRNGEENMEASRRTEFRIRIDNSELLEQIRKLKEGRPVPLSNSFN